MARRKRHFVVYTGHSLGTLDSRYMSSMPVCDDLRSVNLALFRISPRVRVRTSVSIVLGLATMGYSCIGMTNYRIRPHRITVSLILVNLPGKSSESVQCAMLKAGVACADIGQL